MNKRAIWYIIGLMTAALIGIVWLQMSWINESIRQNEAQFDAIIAQSLMQVSKKLEEEENRSILFKNHNAHVDGRNGNSHVVDYAMELMFGLDTTILLENDYYNHFPSDTDCNCDECSAKRRVNIIEFFLLKEFMSPPQNIEDRVDVKKVGKILKQELASNGININYEYGIFSSRKNGFVIINDSYVVDEFSATSNQNESTAAVLPGHNSLYESKYSIGLFPSDSSINGWLMIQFPSKSSIVWGTVWNVLLASILFTGIILFCFAYTIQVIFLQKKVSEMKTDFINNMTHEFKTPIATISLAADSISSPMIVGNESKVKRFANIIKQENKRMLSQVEKVLQMALLDKQDFELKKTKINLHELIQQAVGNASLQVEQKGGTVTANLNATKPNIEGDLTHISNIIHNLLDNANKYSPQKPEISVHTRNVRDGVEVIIQDKGIGMDKESLKHIFDKFYRVHTGNLHDVKGFGLGLSYVKAMMTAHKGQINVKSDLGKGSSFILTFPFKTGTQ